MPLCLGNLAKTPVTAGGLSFVGSAAGDNSATLPAGIQSGDFILVIAFRDGSTTRPTEPAGYTRRMSSSATTSTTVCYKFHTTGSTTGTFTNATALICLVYRNVNTFVPLGNGSIFHNASDLAIHEAITLHVTNGTSWLAAATHCASGSAGTVSGRATGWAFRVSDSDTTDRAGGVDSDGPLSSWAGYSYGTGSSSRTTGVVIELIDASNGDIPPPM